jgi:4-amino-4-deoxy-L-arabinose transferase-like glycosyltransferase
VRIASSRYFWPIATAGLLIVCVIGWLACQIPKGILTNTDELLTAERSREMLLSGRDTVRFNFEQSFAKPPLQYWLTTISLSHLEDRELAVRIWPFIFGSLTAIATGLLAYLLKPNRPWFIPLSIAVLLSCPLFLTEISRGLLDAGLMFFTTIAICFAQLARKQPAWWIGVAIACGLGALQKVPLIFLVWLIIVLARASSKDERRTLKSGWLIGSALLALALAAIWPLIQFVQVHAQTADVARVGPLQYVLHELSRRPYFEIPLRMSILWIGGGTLALLAPIIILVRRKKSDWSEVEMSILCLSIAVLAIVFNFRSVRYLVPIIPCFCLLLAFLLQWLFEQPRRAVRLTAITIALLLFAIDSGEGGWLILNRGKDALDRQQIAEELGARQRLDTATVLVPSHDGGKPYYDSFYLFYGKLRFPIVTRSVDQLREGPLPRPVVGVCDSDDFASIQQIYPDATVRATRGKFVCWESGTAL